MLILVIYGLQMKILAPSGAGVFLLLEILQILSRILKRNKD